MSHTVAPSNVVRLGDARELKKQGRYARVLGNHWRSQSREKLSFAANGLLMDIWSYCADQDVDVISLTAMRKLTAPDAKHAGRMLGQLVAAGELERREDGYAVTRYRALNPVAKAPQLRVIRDEPSGGAGGELGGSWGEAGGKPATEIIEESPPPRARAESQVPSPRFNSPSESLGDDAPPTPPPKLREVRQKIGELEARYDDPELLAEARQGCANTRKAGRLADPVWLAVLLKLAAIERGAVLAALHEYVERYADGDRGEGYLVAIARGKAKRGDTLRKTTAATPRRAPAYVIAPEEDNTEEILALLRGKVAS